MHNTQYPNSELNLLTNDSFVVDNQELANNLKQAYFWLGNLKGKVAQIPNIEIFLMPLVIIESVKSSNIESINSTVLDQLQMNFKTKTQITVEQKLTQNYKEALLKGYNYIQKTNKFDLDLILLIQKTILPDSDGIRNEEPVVIANTATGKILWKPPIGKKLINNYLKNWILFCNKSNNCDELTQVSILHSQFEAIHPFVDGNGRTGRILIILFLIYKGLLSYPCLFISDYILKTRTYYYIALQDSQVDKNNLTIANYITKAILEKSQHTCNMIDNFSNIKLFFESNIKSKLPNIYSQELIQYLCQNPFYSIGSICSYLGITRNTASKYFTKLLKQNIIQAKQSRKNKLFYSEVFLKILT
jgi:Fic family protein